MSHGSINSGPNVSELLRGVGFRVQGGSLSTFEPLSVLKVWGFDFGVQGFRVKDASFIPRNLNRHIQDLTILKSYSKAS